ncbi:MAG: 5'-3' exonuclease H3TH domain-containing protein, partial [Mariprofundaceae bacterium]
MPHLVLIDGPNYVFRAFHAIRRLSNAEGMPTNAVFGYVQMLRAILRDLRPTHLAVVFDPEDGTFRNRLYPEYKAHRPPMPDDLRVQWPWVFEVTRAFRAPLLMVEDYEADDIIATLTREARSRDWEVSIVSTDKDLMQLVTDKVWMVDTMKGVEYGPEEVRKRWGVPPTRIRDLLALTGDSSDNIPGVPGIGPKTAAQLLEQWGDLAGVLEHAESIPQPKRRENLLAHADEARLSFDLVRLEDRVPLPVTLDDLAMRKPDAQKLAEVFEKLGFRRLTEEFAALAGGDAAGREAKAGALEAALDDRAVPERRDRVVTDEAALDALLAALRASDLTAIDTET